MDELREERLSSDTTVDMWCGVCLLWLCAKKSDSANCNKLFVLLAITISSETASNDLVSVVPSIFRFLFFYSFDWEFVTSTWVSAYLRILLAISNTIYIAPLWLQFSFCVLWILILFSYIFLRRHRRNINCVVWGSFRRTFLFFVCLQLLFVSIDCNGYCVWLNSTLIYFIWFAVRATIYVVLALALVVFAEASRE